MVHPRLHIQSDKTRLIHDAISLHSQYGMQTFDQSLYDLYTGS